MLPKPPAPNLSKAAPVPLGAPVSTPKIPAKPQLPGSGLNLQSPRLVAKNVSQALGPGAQAPLPSPNRAAFPPFLSQPQAPARPPRPGAGVSPESLKNLQRNLAPGQAPASRTPAALPARTAPNQAKSVQPESPAPPRVSLSRAERPSPARLTSAASAQPSASPPPKVAPRPTTEAPSPPISSRPSSNTEPNQGKASKPETGLGEQARSKLGSQLVREETRSNRPVIRRETPQPKEEASPAQPEPKDLKEPLPERGREPAVAPKEGREGQPQPADGRLSSEAVKLPEREHVPSSPGDSAPKPETPTPPAPTPQAEARPAEHRGASASGGQGGGKGGGQRRRSRRQEGAEDDVETDEIASDDAQAGWSIAFLAEARTLIPVPRMLQLAKLEADRYAIARASQEQGDGQPPPRREPPQRPRDIPEGHLEEGEPSAPREPSLQLHYCERCGVPLAGELAQLCLGCQSHRAQALLALGPASFPYRLFWSKDPTPVESMAIFRLRDFAHFGVLFKTIS